MPASLWRSMYLCVFKMRANSVRSFFPGTNFTSLTFFFYLCWYVCTIRMSFDDRVREPTTWYTSLWSLSLVFVYGYVFRTSRCLASLEGKWATNSARKSPPVLRQENLYEPSVRGWMVRGRREDANPYPTVITLKRFDRRPLEDDEDIFIVVVLSVSEML